MLIIHSRTGESPWVMEIINKYHDIAKANGAIVSLGSFIGVVELTE